MVAAIFDIEGTLFRGQMGRGFVAYAQENGRWLRAQLYFLSLMPKYIGYQLGWLPAKPLFHDAIERMAWLIGGFDQAQADAVYDWVARDYILPTGHQPVLDRWRWHRGEGHRTYIVSGGLEPCVAIIADELQANGFRGTKVEQTDGIVSGRTIPPVVMGDAKRQAALKMVEADLDVDWEASYAYADSLHDLPVLELVGHPVAVYPDEALAEVATERGWQIIQQTQSE
jgi:HAD superfamily hydrolase (TIGR01490 family)